MTNVRPLLEYALSVWDHRHAARWVLSDHSHCNSSVTEMLKLLEWPTLETRRHLNILNNYKIVHQLATVIQISPYYLTTHMQHPTTDIFTSTMHFISPATSTTA